MTFLSKAIVVLVFQFDEYVHVSQNSHLKKFSHYIRKSIRLIIINRLRSTTTRSTNKDIRNFSYSFLFYSSDWLFNRAALRRIIQRFDKDIVDYRISLINDLSFKSTALKTNRFRFQFSTTNVKNTETNRLSRPETIKSTWIER